MRYVDETLTKIRSFEPGLGTFGWMDDGSGAGTGAGTTMPDASTVSHYHTDLIGTTRRMSDSTGAASPSGGGSPGEPVTYTAFGERISGTPSDRYGYASAWGYQSHDDFPFLHVGARYYDPATGRFLQRDPIGIRGGLNVYEYVHSNPLVSVDRDGLIPEGSEDNFFKGRRKLRPAVRDSLDKVNLLVVGISVVVNCVVLFGAPSAPPPLPKKDPPKKPKKEPTEPYPVGDEPTVDPDIPGTVYPGTREDDPTHVVPSIPKDLPPGPIPG